MIVDCGLRYSRPFVLSQSAEPAADFRALPSSMHRASLGFRLFDRTTSRLPHLLFVSSRECGLVISTIERASR
jgi:hypothetical protein